MVIDFTSLYGYWELHNGVVFGWVATRNNRNGDIRRVIV